MKRLIQTTLLIGILSFGLAPVTFAQDIDANRMNRDIRIMENILGELFKMQTNTTQTSGAYTITAYGRGTSGARGTYLPGFGVIFSVNNNSVMFPGRVTVADDGPGFVFYYGDEDGETEELKVDEESVKERITEFLQNYASTIGQLNDDDRVMIIFGSSKQITLRVFRAREERVASTSNADALPVISGSVKVGDIKAYRARRIDEGEFVSRIDFATSQNETYTDLEILSDIFETALSDNAERSFRVIGGVDYLMLDNFGALYSFDVRFSGRSVLSNGWTTRVLRGNVVAATSSEQRNSDEAIQEYQQAISSAFDALKTNIAEYMVDYGRTLTTIGADQYLSLSVSIHGRHEGIPERMDFQIKQSVLEQYDRGRTSREEALRQVVITEY